MSFDSTQYKAGGNDLGQAAPGNHLSTLVGLVTLGLQDGGSWKGQPKPPVKKLAAIFELSDDQVIIDGVARNRIYTRKVAMKSGDRAGLTEIMRALDPTGANAKSIDKNLGRPCFLNLVAKPLQDGTGTYTAFEGIMGLPEGFPAPAVQTPLFVFDLDAPVKEVYLGLQAWIKDTIKAGLDFQGSKAQQLITQWEAEAQSQALNPQTQPPQQAAPTPPPVAQAQVPPGGLPQSFPPLAGQPAFVPPAQTGSVPHQTPPVQQPSLPAAPPGYRYDPATNSFVLE